MRWQRGEERFEAERVVHDWTTTTSIFSGHLYWYMPDGCTKLKVVKVLKGSERGSY